ncbi:MAG: corrinoid protein-associated methyltransferase CpaM [Promethearchaeota archaeon]
MSYVYMKSLEKKAEKYDKGIKLLTLGKLPKIKQFIVDNYIKSEDKLLDIGMGTGTFAVLAAKKGADVIGIDISEKMLKVASERIRNEELTEKIKIIKMPVVELDNTFENEIFDKVIAILSFSEFYEKEREFCIKQIYRILKENGEFILVDEVKPRKFFKKIVYFLIRIPLAFITFLKAHVSTSALKKVEDKLVSNGFNIIEKKFFLFDSLELIRAKKRLEE